MTTLFCKKTVFSILFLISFAVGTICGVLLFRLMLPRGQDWILDYCVSLRHSMSVPPIFQVLLLVRPFLIVFAAGLLPFRRKLIPALIALRGCLLAYTCSAFYSCDVVFTAYLLRNLLCLPLYYSFCAFCLRLPVADH